VTCSARRVVLPVRPAGTGAELVVADAQRDQVLDRGRVDVAGDHRDDHRVAGHLPGGVAVEPGAAVPGGDRVGGAARRRRNPGKDAPPEQTTRWEQDRHQQSSQRICVDHSIAEPKQWRTLQRWTGRREYFQDTALAIAGLVSDRAAMRQSHTSQPTRPARADPNRAPTR
jgi:hypothetical protein